MATSTRREAAEQPGTPEQRKPDGSTSSGEGAASALARLKTQHEHRARQRPADDPGETSRQP